MAGEPTPQTLLRLHTEINLVKAREAELKAAIRQRALVEIVPLKAATIARGLRFRELFLTAAPARYAAVLAADRGIEPAIVNVALVTFARAALVEITGPAGRQRLTAEIRARGRGRAQKGPPSAAGAPAQRHQPDGCLIS
jgi:hypothetical protein